MCHPHAPGEPEPLAGVIGADVTVEGWDGVDLPARVVRPDGDAWAAIVIATDIYGANRFYKSIAQRLAAEGVAAILPDLFVREGGLAEVTREAAFDRRALLDDRRAVGELWASLDRLVDETGAPGATLGFCLGGNIVYHMTADRPGTPTIAYYGFPGGLPSPKSLPRPLDCMDRFAGPILSFWGEDDHKVGLGNVEAWKAEVVRLGIDSEHHVYAGMEHGFLAGLDASPDDPTHGAAVDSWTRMIDFLRHHATAGERAP